MVAPKKDSPSPPNVESLPPAEWSVPAELDGAWLDRVVKARFPSTSWNRLRSWIEQGKFFVDGAVHRQANTPLAAGAVVRFAPTGRRDAQIDPDAAWLVFVDSQVVVVDKPAGISTVPFEDSERDSLDKRVARVLRERGRSAPLHVVHRLDKETSGILVFARTDAALRHLKNQFRFHTTHRRYLALVHGHPRSQTLSSRLVQNRGDGLRGSTTNPTLGRPAVTHVRVLETFAAASLVECELETGRTHQIRIHLAEAGHPLLGERVYSRGFTGALLPAPRVLLHAAELGFDHPVDQRRLHFEKEAPADFLEALRELRAASGARPPAPRADAVRRLHGPTPLVERQQRADIARRPSDRAEPVEAPSRREPTGFRPSRPSGRSAAAAPPPRPGSGGKRSGTGKRGGSSPRRSGGKR